MFPTRHHRNGTTWNSTAPAMTGSVRGAAAKETAAATLREPPTPILGLASRRGRLANRADRGRTMGALRRIASVALAACVLAGPTAVAADDVHPAQHLAQQVASRVIESLESQREAIAKNPEQLYGLVDRLVLPYFDFERMSRRVLGRKRWKNATAEQQARFVSAFRTLVVRTYALILTEYRGQAIEFLDPVARKRDDEIIIPLKVRLDNNQAVTVAYAMQGSGPDWKVFDVAIDGVSLVTNYRSSFRSEVARHGIDGLTDRIEAKNSATK